MGFMDRFKGAAESGQGATAGMGIGATPEQMELANRAQRLNGSGVDTSAHINAMTATGNTDAPGGTEYNITLMVSPAGGEAYLVTTNQYIYPRNPFNEGENVTVKVDPDDQNVLMIFGHA